VSERTSALSSLCTSTSEGLKLAVFPEEGQKKHALAKSASKPSSAVASLKSETLTFQRQRRHSWAGRRAGATSTAAAPASPEGERSLFQLRQFSKREEEDIRLEEEEEKPQKCEGTSSSSSPKYVGVESEPYFVVGKMLRRVFSKEMFPTPVSFCIFVAYMGLFVSQGMHFAPSVSANLPFIFCRFARDGVAEGRFDLSVQPDDGRLTDGSRQARNVRRGIRKGVREKSSRLLAVFKDSSLQPFCDKIGRRVEIAPLHHGLLHDPSIPLLSLQQSLVHQLGHLRPHHLLHVHANPSSHDRRHISSEKTNTCQCGKMRMFFSSSSSDA